MSLTSDIFGVLLDAGEPISLSDIVTALPTGAERHAVCKLLSARKKAGEIQVTIEDGKPHYALLADFDPAKRPRRGGCRTTKRTKKPLPSRSGQASSALPAHNNPTLDSTVAVLADGVAAALERAIQEGGHKLALRQLVRSSNALFAAYAALAVAGGEA